MNEAAITFISGDVDSRAIVVFILKDTNFETLCLPLPEGRKAFILFTQSCQYDE